MELHATREFGDIVNLLESLEEKIEAEIEKFQVDFTQKFSLETTHDILQYATDFVKMKVNLVIKDTIKDFNWFSVVVDCTEINLNMYEIEALLQQVKRQMKDTIPQDPTVEDMQITLKKYLRKVICKIPTKWTEPIVLEFLKQFKNTLEQLGISVG